MRFISHLSIVTKISLVSAVAILSFLIYLGVNASVGADNKALLERTKNLEFPALRSSDKLLVSLERLKEQFVSAITTADLETLTASQATKAGIEQELGNIETLLPEFAGDISIIERQLDNYYQQAYRLSQTIIDGSVDFNRLAEQSATMNSGYESLESDVRAFQEQQLAQFTRSFAQIQDSAANLIKFGIFLSLITIAALIVITWSVFSSIKRNLLGVVNSLRAIAQENGDLTLRLKADTGDEIGDLVFWFNSFMDKLQDVIRNVINTSEPLGAVANNLAEVASDANSAIDAQRQSADRAKAAVDEMSHTVDEVANSASLAADAAVDATKTAREGQVTVQETVGSIQHLAKNVSDIQQVIHKLEEDSSRVGSVLDVIKGIAEQTNLLALNAAIEAARAGEQGRGFAVVADEVRTLASRTRESTDEIRNTIEKLQSAAQTAVQVMSESSKQAQLSVDNANNAGSSLDGIHASITNINSMNNTIANATREQARVSQEIVEIIHDIHTSTGQTLDRSGKLQDTSRELIALATALNDINRKFKI